MSETLYGQVHLVQFKSPDAEDKQLSIRISVELLTTTSPLHRKDLLVRLTDDKDPFFLYNLCLGEEDFQSLKTQQGLLVDFSAFPQRFIALLQQCRGEQSKDTPKFLLQFEVDESSLASYGGLSMGNGVLKVIETNPFKHLVHLSLNLLPGNDSDVKKYLASCLKVSLERQQVLEEQLEKTELDLKGKLEQTRQQLSNRTRELDQLRLEAGGRSERLSLQHTRELNQEREKALKIQEDTQQRHDKEKKELETLYQKNIRQKEARLNEMETTNKELTDRRYRAEATIREQKTKLNALEEEHRRCRSELQQTRRENSSLDAERHAQDKNIQQLKTRVAVLEQELLDKEQLVARITSSLDSAQQQKEQLDDRRAEQQSQIRKLEATIKTMSEEILKGNEIIKKLQDDLRGYMSKVKLKNEVTTRQEHVISEKEKLNEKLKKELDENTRNLKNAEDEVAKLKDQLLTTVAKLEESKGLLKTNENVINWLNKQLNERQISSRRPPTSTATQAMTHHVPSAESQPSAGVAFKPNYDRQSPHYSTPIGPNSIPSHISTTQGTPMSAINANSSPAALLPRPSVPGTPQVVYNPGKNNKENQQPNSGAERNPIDPKYLARSTEVITVRSSSLGGAPSPPKHQTSDSALCKPASRLSQQVIGKAALSRPNVRFQPEAHQQQPSVVSAYFAGTLPKQAG